MRQPKGDRGGDYRVECRRLLRFPPRLHRAQAQCSIPAAGPTMSNPPPASYRRFPVYRSWRPWQRALLWVLLAFAAGVALFALVLSGARDKPEFYRGGDTPPN